MRYYYRLANSTQWTGPYEDGRACIFDAAFAGQQAHSSVQAVVVADEQNPDALIDAPATLFDVPTQNLSSDIKHPMYEPPIEWVNEQQLGDGTEDPDTSGQTG